MIYFAYKRRRDGLLVTGTDYAGGVTASGYRTQICKPGLSPIIVSDVINDMLPDRFKEPRATMVTRMMDPSLYVPVEIEIKTGTEHELEPLDNGDLYSPYGTASLKDHQKHVKAPDAPNPEVFAMGERSVVKIDTK